MTSKRGKRIVLVEPSSGFNAYQFVRIPLVGLLYIATTLKRAGYNVVVLSELDKRVLDHSGRRLDRELLSADVVGISIMTAEHADVVVTGEGEDAVVKAVDPDNESRIVAGELVQELDNLPFPEFELQRGLVRTLRFAPVSASRGCPFDCSFCCVTRVYGRKVRFRSVESVIEELCLRWRQGYRRLFFSDDNFGANKEWTKALLEEMLRREMNFSWVAQARADVGRDPDLLGLIRKSNCCELFIGLEAVTQDTLDTLNKRQRVEEIVESIKRLNEHKIDICGMFIVGSDSDSKQTIRDTLDFCNRMNLCYAQFSILAPFPGTKVASDLEAQQRIFDRNWSHYDGTHVVFRPANFSPFSLQEDVLTLWKGFYSWAKGFKSLAARYFLRKWEKANRWYLSQLRAYTAALAKYGPSASYLAGQSVGKR